MSEQGRLFLEALRFCARLPAGASEGTDGVEPGAAARYVPVVGLLIGAVGGAVYWLGAQLWPTSIAVVLSMLATSLLPGGKPLLPGFGVAGFVFALLLKYNTLMALSAASLPFAVPTNVALGLIMICGHAASRALVVLPLAASAPASAPASHAPVSTGDLILALGVGFVPATLLGIPGLIGLAVALVARVAFGAYLRRSGQVMANGASYATQQLTEVCFYLGALASWVYV